MSDIKTDYLKLVKPVAGSTNWGNAQNNNWDIIDRNYNLLNTNIKSIESRMNDLSMFYFWEKDKTNNSITANNGDYVFIELQGNNMLTIGYSDLDNDGAFTAASELTDVSTLADLIGFNNYSAFYIINEGQLPRSSKSNENDKIDFKRGDLLVITQEVVENQTFVFAHKLAQAIGCVYELKQEDDGNTNKITAEKTLNPLAPEYINFYIPTVIRRSSRVEAVYGNDNTDDFTNLGSGGEGIALNTRVADTYTEESITYNQYIENVECFYNGKRIIVDYEISYNGEQYIITFKLYGDNFALPIGTKVYYSITHEQKTIV